MHANQHYIVTQDWSVKGRSLSLSKGKAEPRSLSLPKVKGKGQFLLLSSSLILAARS